MPRTPVRIDGYAPIADYGAIGDGRVAALVALDGSIDWLCLPRFDGPSVLAALLDARAGGRFALAPEAPFAAERRYLPGTNVLETTFTTSDGALRVTDAMTVAETGPLPWTELVRRVEGLSGSVPLRWCVERRFEWGAGAGRLTRMAGVPTFACGRHLLAVPAWGAGEPDAGDGRVEGRTVVGQGERATVALCAFHDEPVLLPDPEAPVRRLGDTVDHWRRRARTVAYDGPWRDAVVRSALALELLVHEPTGAIAAAATSSLPERIGGSRNWDYRFAWLRDTAFALEAMLGLGYDDRVHASLAWLLHATRGTHPRLGVFYRLDGGPPVAQQELGLEGYRRSRPAVAGNGAAGQLQLGNYGDLMQTAWLYVRDGNALDPGSATRLAEVADFACEVWRSPDASIWELPRPDHYTQGKLATWLAADRAARLAGLGALPADRAPRWRRAAEEMRRFVERRCFSAERGAYARAEASSELDAAVLVGARGSAGLLEGSDPRLAGTIDALRRELGDGPLLYRFSGAAEQEGAFLACSFWLVEALARAGRIEEAAELMDELVGLANDVGLYSEQMDPVSGELLGNFPQALTHLSLVNAALQLSRTGGR